MRVSTILPILVGSASLEVIDSIVASPNPYELFDDDGTSLGNVTVRGGDVNHWVEDKDGYTICGVDGSTHVHERHLITAQRQRHKHSRVNEGQKHVRSSNTTGSGGNKTHFYYCAQTEDGNVVPNTDYPVATTDPNRVSNDTLPAHVHKTEYKAVEDCGDFCKDEVKDGAGARRRRMEASPTQTTGFLPNLVVAFRFSDHETKELPRIEDLEILMNSEEIVPDIAPTKGVKQVFLDNSNYQFEIHSTVTNWVSLDPQYTESYCADNSAGLGYVLHECLHNALSKVDASIDFTEFDPNGDGYIDSIAFLHSGYGAEHTNNMNSIWSHKWKFYQLIDGERVKMEWTSDEGIKVHTFHISPALWGYYGNEIGRVGVIAHETAHFLGLDDLYDNDIGAGIGYWSLMANAWGFDRSQQYPPFLDPYSKGELGWASFTELTESENGVVVTPSYGTHEYYIIRKGFPDGEYLIIENRQREGFDELISQAGLLIWHIDELKDSNREEGWPGQPGWPENNKHYKVALLGADGTYHLEKGWNPGDAGDVFTEVGVSSLDSSTDSFPNTASYQNGTLMETGVQIRNIRSDGENMLFDICFDYTCVSDEDENDPAPINDSGPSTGCELVSDWRDIYNDSCLWYEEHDSKGCRNEGSVLGTGGVRASDACCHCRYGK